MLSSDAFDEFTAIDTFKRVDDSHPLELYIGTDSMSRNTLLLVSDDFPKVITSSQLIHVTVGSRKDGRAAISFSLVNDDFEDLFINVCNDIIETSRTIKPGTNGTDFVTARYAKWQKMLARHNGDLLSDSSVKGLIGELCFLRDYMIPAYGQDQAIRAWIGPESADQDFVCGDTWYEVKSTVSGAENVRVSSVEQLDTPTSGHLAVMFLDKTSSADNARISLNALVTEVQDSLEDETLKSRLARTLLGLGYLHSLEYDRLNFKFAGTKLYSVGPDFPCLRRTDLTPAVGNVKYDLYLPAIANYEISSQPAPAGEAN